MAQKLTFRYNRNADTLFIDTCKPYSSQESKEMDDDVIVRVNRKTKKVENIEVLFFSSRLLRQTLFEIPVTADLMMDEGR